MIEKMLRWIVIAGIFALPFIVFIVANTLFFPFITGKNFAFRIIVEIITGAWLALALVNPEYRPRKSWLLGAFAVFVVIIAAADLHGVNPFKSFWSNYERMDGWVTLAHLFAYFVVASSIFSTRELWRRFWLTSLWVSVIAGLYGILQFVGISALGTGGTGGLGARLDATFGNPIYLAVFMLFNIFVAAFLWVENWTAQPTGKRSATFAWGVGFGLLILDVFIFTSSHPPGADMSVALSQGELLVTALLNFFIVAFLWAGVWWERPVGGRFLISTWYGSVIALDTIILFSTGTRGTILGLIGGLLLAVFLVAVLYRGEGPARRIALSLAVSMLILGAGFWLVRGEIWVKKVGFLNRLATISITDNTVKARIMNWGMAWEGVKERPVLGWGQENFAIVFDKYYNPQMYAQEQWFDRVHNIIFDWLVAGGFLGLLGYLSLFVFALWAIWKSRLPASQTRQAGANNTESFRGNARNASKSTENTATFSLLEQSILSGLLAGYFFHNLFVFDNITSYVLFTTILAYIASRSAAERNSPVLFPSGNIPSSALPVIAVLVVVAVWGTAWWVNGRALAQNRVLLQAIAPQMTANVFEIGATNFWPNDPESHLTLAAAYYATGHPADSVSQLEAVRKLASSDATGDVLRTESDTLIQEITDIGTGKGAPAHREYFEKAIQSIKKKADAFRPSIVDQLRNAEQSLKTASVDNAGGISAQVSNLTSVISVLDALAGNASDALVLEVNNDRPKGLFRNLAYFDESIAYGSLGTQEAREQLVQAASQLMGNKNVPVDVRQKFVELAAREMALQEKASPLDARFPLFSGVLFDAAGDYADAAVVLRRAHELSLAKQTILFELATNAQARGSDAEALEYFKEAFDLAPEFTSARIYYAATAIRMKQDSLADEILAPIVASGGAAVTNIAAAYADRGLYGKIVTIWTARVKAVPEDIQAHFTLAAALVGAGNPAQAILQLQELERTIPSTKAQVDEFIQQIRSGTAKI